MGKLFSISLLIIVSTFIEKLNLHGEYSARYCSYGILNSQLSSVGRDSEETDSFIIYGLLQD
jgi:hypothetical protein